MEGTQTQQSEQSPQQERTDAQKESDARALAEKVLFLQKEVEEEWAKPMMRVVAHDETDQKDPKANAARVSRLKKLYGF